MSSGFKRIHVQFYMSLERASPLVRVWRNRESLLRLVGEVCPDCKKKIFPPRDVCPYCHQQTKNSHTECDTKLIDLSSLGI